jgi:hypothetical protein
LFRRNPWLIGPGHQRYQLFAAMPAQPSSDGLGFFFDMPAQNGVHYVTEASVLVPL